jgi:hypothetical protein
MDTAKAVAENGINRKICSSADSDDVNGPFRRDVNKSERSDAGICNDARDYSHESRDGLFLAGMGAWGKGTAFEFPCPTPAL